MQELKPMRIIALALVFIAFAMAGLFVMVQVDPAMAADEPKLWVNDDYNILTLVPEGWIWKENIKETVPVVFLPSGEEDKGIPDFVFVTYLGKQSGSDLEKIKGDYIKGLKGDLDNFKLNSAESVTTSEGLSAYDLSYTFTQDKKPALGYDRLVLTGEEKLWAISFSAGKDDFKRLREGALSIVDAFIFDAAQWLEDKQKDNQDH